MIKDHFTELLLCVMFLIICGVSMWVGDHAHNDQLSNKLLEYAGQVLGALFLALRGYKAVGPPSS